jgi:hypothetical protein
MSAASKSVDVSQRGLRTPERVFRFVLWIIAALFAGFLIGLTSLVVRDLPTVGHVELYDFVDKAKSTPLDADIVSTAQQQREADERLAPLELQQQSARAAYRNARLGFDNWVATRQSTQRADQDPEVIRRTRELDDLSVAARTAEVAVEKARASRLALDQHLAAARRGRAALDLAAQDDYDRAVRLKELHVFLVRLAITLPPIAIAVWLFTKQRRSSWWPFVWGFVLFAIYEFFVELVPYVPSYRGYVRYALGIVITVVVGRYAIVAMQRYLERQRVAEQQSEDIRRKSLSYEHAIKSMNAGVCPGCERGFKVHDGQTDFCMHCGMKLFDHCLVCSSHKNAFFHFCPKCGTDKPSEDAAPRDAMTVAPVA